MYSTVVDFTRALSTFLRGAAATGITHLAPQGRDGGGNAAHRG
jgi:hypothetical protein